MAPVWAVGQKECVHLRRVDNHLGRGVCAEFGQRTLIHVDLIDARDGALGQHVDDVNPLSTGLVARLFLDPGEHAAGAGPTENEAHRGFRRANGLRAWFGAWGARNLGRTRQARKNALHTAKHILERAHRVVHRLDRRSDELDD